jgi:hypothetical protein
MHKEDPSSIRNRFKERNKKAYLKDHDFLGMRNQERESFLQGFNVFIARHTAEKTE